jgi:hypothetical protein
MTYLKEARFVNQAEYGEYCNKVRSKGIEPVPYHEFMNSFDDKKQWVNSTIEYWRKKK